MGGGDTPHWCWVCRAPARFSTMQEKHVIFSLKVALFSSGIEEDGAGSSSLSSTSTLCSPTESGCSSVGRWGWGWCRWAGVSSWTVPSTRHVVKRLGLTVYKGVQGRKHWSLRASVHGVLQLLGGRGLLGQAAGLQGGHGSTGGVVGADVLLVTSSAVLEPDLERKLYLLVAKQWKVEPINIFPAAEPSWIHPEVCLSSCQHQQHKWCH